VINIKPGWKKGTKVTFACEGDEGLNLVPADICFVLEEAPHDKFEREANDLVYTAHIPLADALTGKPVRAALGGRVRAIISGGSALAPHLETFFDAAGVNVIAGYGLTETSPGASRTGVRSPGISSAGRVVFI
jgi:long-subunit acyl-CoA synthetase (AMP-forming)